MERVVFQGYWRIKRISFKIFSGKLIKELKVKIKKIDLVEKRISGGPNHNNSLIKLEKITLTSFKICKKKHPRYITQW